MDTRQTKMRVQATQEEIDAVLEKVKEGLLARIKKHGQGKFVSRAEAMGILVEEHHETIEALHSNDLDRFLSEMMDVAVTGIWANVSLQR